MVLARHRRGVALAAVALVLGLACEGSGFQYVQNEDYNAYFKLDADWTLFDEQDFFASPALQLDPLERQRRLATTWIRGFDAARPPALANVFTNNTPEPHGVARIQVLTEAERESLDITDLRAAHLGYDPVQVKREDPQGPVEILFQEDLALEGGQHGVRMVVAFDTPSGDTPSGDTPSGNKQSGATSSGATPSGDIAIIDQTALVDSAEGLLYLFVVGCSSRCYAENQEAIKEIADSWTVEEAP